ncbi:lipoprotein NlpD/LppB [Saccharospirillum salsuginis]|uniref:Lipoprotein NlpD/LppB n=1 Tax=Saccharospirillum salsuginis TaxID=418750 RepID=A0A918KFQ8_9GAMM|nr:lipoprotein NlpD/LppB [Saccharospirillum salsuginis]
MVKSGGESLKLGSQIASKLLGGLTVAVMVTGCFNNAAYSSLEGRPKPSSGTTSQTTRPTVSPSTTPNPGRYQVRRGDTLYSIAFRYGLDYKKLAAANDIGSDYTIFVGQTLVLREAEPPVRQSEPKPTPSSNRPQTSSSQTVTKVNKEESAVKEGASVSASNANISWNWPHGGKIVRTFNPNVSDRKGVDLVGQIGDSVRAAAEGTVVYAGNGLPGYGNLIILEHSDALLSAYAFNQELLVGERDRVERGQVIARMGKQGDQPGLHFEIRREGKPVDPMRYLPQR